MIHLDDQTIEQLLDLAGVTAVVGAAFAAWGRGEASTTQRVRASVPGAMASAMAAVVPPFTGGKVYATKDGKFTFLNVLFGTDGQLLCTLDGDALTAFRTPAACALAIRELATVAGRPSANQGSTTPSTTPSTTTCTTAALVGAGRQGWYHLEMLALELPGLLEVRIADINPQAVTTMVARAKEAGIPAIAAADAASAVDGAQVIVTITQSTASLFPSSAVGDDALICAVGATKYDRCEIGPELIARCAAVVCDDVVGSRVECGDLIQAHAAGAFDWDRAVELHAVMARTVQLPRAGAAPVLFETQGVALQDVAAAGLAWQRHQSLSAFPNSGIETSMNHQETTP